MFRRFVRRLLLANRGRFFVILLALATGAAVAAALLNLQIDAKRRLTNEFRSFGPNVVIAHRDSSAVTEFLDESLFNQIPDHTESGEIAKAEFLYGIVDVIAEKGENSGSRVTAASRRVILTGYAHSYLRPKEVISRALAEAEEQYLGVS